VSKDNIIKELRVEIYEVNNELGKYKDIAVEKEGWKRLSI
jgi:hypothetical protein